MKSVPLWIPAFAGMTIGLVKGVRMQEGTNTIVSEAGCYVSGCVGCVIIGEWIAALKPAIQRSGLTSQ